MTARWLTETTLQADFQTSKANSWNNLEKLAPISPGENLPRPRVISSCGIPWLTYRKFHESPHLRSNVRLPLQVEKASKSRLKSRSYVLASKRRVPMKKPMFNVTNVIATAGVLIFGYIFFASLPDLRRYIRISAM